MTAPIAAPDTKRRQTRTSYQSSYAADAERLCRLGATNDDLAEAFGVVEKTVRNWMRREPAFAKAVRRGKLDADMNVAESLYQRACGARQTERRVVRRDGKEVVTEITRELPPETRACAFWLKNRRPDLWRDGALPRSQDAGEAAYEPEPEAEQPQNTSRLDSDSTRHVMSILNEGEAAAVQLAAAAATGNAAAPSAEAEERIKRGTYILITIARAECQALLAADQRRESTPALPVLPATTLDPTGIARRWPALAARLQPWSSYRGLDAWRAAMGRSDTPSAAKASSGASPAPALRHQPPHDDAANRPAQTASDTHSGNSQRHRGPTPPHLRPDPWDEPPEPRIVRQRPPGYKPG
ncbi:MAG TPA: hypothetical protein VJ890_02105 [Vineibacter sp.]|nr:hypothetical protein [Vineibacter sp.]